MIHRVFEPVIDMHDPGLLRMEADPEFMLVQSRGKTRCRRLGR